MQSKFLPFAYGGFARRVKLAIVRARLVGRAASIWQVLNRDHQHVIGKRQGQHVTGADRVAELYHAVPIAPDMTFLD